MYNLLQEDIDSKEKLSQLTSPDRKVKGQGRMSPSGAYYFLSLCGRHRWLESGSSWLPARSASPLCISEPLWLNGRGIWLTTCSCCCCASVFEYWCSCALCAVWCHIYNDSRATHSQEDHYMKRTLSFSHQHSERRPTQINSASFKDNVSFRAENIPARANWTLAVCYR